MTHLYYGRIQNPALQIILVFFETLFCIPLSKQRWYQFMIRIQVGECRVKNFEMKTICILNYGPLNDTEPKWNTDLHALRFWRLRYRRHDISETLDIVKDSLSGPGF